MSVGMARATPRAMPPRGRLDEHYRYADGAHRSVKQQNACATVRYLPGVELRSDAAGAGSVLTCRQWCCARGGMVRYRLADRQRSTTVELDGDGACASCEAYYPYGGTACRHGAAAHDAGSRTVRHAGKERDATGFYYFGYRYYAPWLARWVSADPAFTVDGLNLFAMVRGNPVSLHDADGRMIGDGIDMGEIGNLARSAGSASLETDDDDEVPLPPDAEAIVARARQLFCAPLVQRYLAPGGASELRAWLEWQRRYPALGARLDFNRFVALQLYSSSFYRDINRVLRGKQDDPTGGWRALADAADAGLHSLRGTSLNAPGRVFRGTYTATRAPGEVLAHDVPVGGRYVNPAFTSASPSWLVAQGFATPRSIDDVCELAGMVIFAHSGIRIGSISIEDEQEVLFARGTSFTVLASGVYTELTPGLEGVQRRPVHKLCLEETGMPAGAGRQPHLLAALDLARNIVVRSNKHH